MGTMSNSNLLDIKLIAVGFINVKLVSEGVNLNVDNTWHLLENLSPVSIG